MTGWINRQLIRCADKKKHTECTKLQDKLAGGTEEDIRQHKTIAHTFP